MTERVLLGRQLGHIFKISQPFGWGFVSPQSNRNSDICTLTGLTSIATRIIEIMVEAFSILGQKSLVF